MKDQRPLGAIPDDELLRRLIALTQRSHRIEADLVAHIAEVDARRLYAREASPSMFAYCTGILHLSEAEAYVRIAAARASRKHPMLLAMLGDGRIHLSGIAKLAPHLTRENAEGVLERAAHRSKRQIEELVAELAPRPDAPAAVRRLPSRRQNAPSPLAPSPAGEDPPSSHELGLNRASTAEPGTRPDPAADPAAVNHHELRPDAVVALTVAPVFPALPTIVQPLAPGRYKVQFTASAELRDKLERLRRLMLPQVPSGDLGEVIDCAVTETLERIEAQRFARSSKPRKGLGQANTAPASRHLPAAVKRVVHERDGGRCRYVDTAGRRCPERSGLEYHHRLPFGMGGDHGPTNVSLLCRTHNQYMAEHDYGRKVMTSHRGSTHTPTGATTASTP